MLFGLLLLLLFCPHALTSLPCFLHCWLIVTQCRVLDCISLPCTRFWVIWPHALKPSLSVFEETTPGGSFCRPGSFLAQFDKSSPANQSNQPPPTYLNAATPTYQHHETSETLKIMLCRCCLTRRELEQPVLILFLLCCRCPSKH